MMSEAGIVVRREEPRDCQAVFEVNRQAFGRDAEAKLVDILRASGKVALSLVAERQGQVVGHILFTPVKVCSGERCLPAVGLAPLAVLPEWQKHGIGQRLMRQGLEECRKAGYAAVFVLGYPDYYPRFGFVPAERFGIKCEYDVPSEAFMTLELQPQSLKGWTGVAKYEPEFAHVG